MPNKHGAHNLHNCAAARQARRSTWTRRGGGVSVTFAHYYRLHRPDFTHSHGPTKPQNRQCVRAAHTLCHPGAHMTPPRNPPGATTTHKCRGVDASLRSIARPLSNPLAGGAAASVPFPKTKSCGNFCPLSSPRGLVSSRASPPLLGLTEAKGWGGGIRLFWTSLDGGDTFPACPDGVFRAATRLTVYPANLEPPPPLVGWPGPARSWSVAAARAWRSIAGWVWRAWRRGRWPGARCSVLETDRAIPTRPLALPV